MSHPWGFIKKEEKIEENVVSTEPETVEAPEVETSNETLFERKCNKLKKKFIAESGIKLAEAPIPKLAEAPVPKLAEKRSIFPKTPVPKLAEAPIPKFPKTSVPKL